MNDVRHRLYFLNHRRWCHLLPPRVRWSHVFPVPRFQRLSIRGVGYGTAKTLSTLSQKSATVAENGETTATVAEFGDTADALFCDSVDRL